MWTSGTDDPVRLRQTKNSQRVVATQMLVKKFVLVGDKMSQLRQLFRNRRLVIVAGTTEVGKRRRPFYKNYHIRQLSQHHHWVNAVVNKWSCILGIKMRSQDERSGICGTNLSNATTFVFRVVVVDHSVGSGSQQFDVMSWHQFGGFWKFGTWRRTRTSVCWTWQSPKMCPPGTTPGGCQKSSNFVKNPLFGKTVKFGLPQQENTPPPKTWNLTYGGLKHNLKKTCRLHIRISRIFGLLATPPKNHGNLPNFSQKNVKFVLVLLTNLLRKTAWFGCEIQRCFGCWIQWKNARKST